MTRITIAIFAVVLAACSPGAPAQVEPEPRFGVQEAPAVAVQQYDLDLTQQALDRVYIQQTTEAGQVATVVAQTTADARATADAQSFSATATAQHLAALVAQDAATAQAGQATRDADSTRAAVTVEAEQTAAGVAVVQTRTTMDLERRADQIARTNRRADFFNAFIFTALICATLSAMFLTWLRVDGKNSQPDFVDSPGYGVWLLVPTPEPGLRGLGRRTVQPQLLLPPGEAIEGEIDARGRIPYTVNGQEQPPITTRVDSNPERTNRELVRYLLREASYYIDATGGRLDVLPGHRNLPLSADAWTRATDILEANRVIKKQSRRPTEFLDPWNIDVALSPANLDRLDFSPARPDAVR
jgi:hypothetical protein